MCFHNDNWCDQHPSCDDAEGEDWNLCANKYNFTKEATFLCQSPYHNEDTVKANLSRAIVWIKAVPQDGVSECWNDADEQPSAWYETYGIPGHCTEI